MQNGKKDFWWVQLRLLCVCVLVCGGVFLCGRVAPQQLEAARDLLLQYQTAEPEVLYAPVLEAADSAGDFLLERFNEISEQLKLLSLQNSSAVYYSAYLTQQSAASLSYPLDSFTVTYTYGQRVHPVSGEADFHRGVDLAAPQGTAVTAVADGVVKMCGVSESYGNFVVILHSDGLYSMYAHLDSVCVFPQMFVTTCTKIGEVGSTGVSSGYHLHLELVKNGYYLDFLTLVSQNVV